MIAKIFGTILSKVLTAGIGFLVVILTTKELGSAARGEIALMLLNISIIGLFQGIFNGSSLIYLTPRHSFSPLLLISNLYTILLGIGLTYLLWAVHLVEANQLNFLLFLSFFQGLLTTSQSLLLGKEKIVYYNYLEIFKTLTLISAILVSFYIYRTINLEVVFYAYLISYIVPFLIGFYWLIPFFKAKKQETNLRLIVVDSLKYGFQIQLNNISQMINYRFSFFLIEKLKGKAELGVFSVALSLSEAIWIICKSIATFQYSKLVNTTDRTEQKRITLLSLHLSFYATLPLIVLLLLLPDSFFNLLFGKDFDSLKIILLALSLGILELSYFTIINHYFTGIGKNKINVIGSIIGNTVTIIACSFLIPILGSFGAGLATSLTYLFMLIYLVLQFKKESQVSILELLPSLSSIRTVLKNRSL